MPFFNKEENLINVSFNPTATTQQLPSFTPAAASIAQQSGSSSISGSSSESSFFSTALDVITFIPRKIWGLIQMLFCCGSKSFKDQIERDPKATATEWIQRVEKEGAKPLNEAMNPFMPKADIDKSKLEIFLYQLFLQSGSISEEGVRGAVVSNIETWHKHLVGDEECLLAMAWQLIDHAKRSENAELNHSLDLTLVETMDLEDLDPYFTNIACRADEEGPTRLAICCKIVASTKEGFKGWAVKFRAH